MNASLNDEETSIYDSQTHDQFSNVLATLSNFRTQITALQQDIRLLERTVKKEVKGLKKTAEKKNKRGNRKPSGFAKPSKVSDNLCLFMKKPKGSEVARTEVTQYLIKYINEHKLQNSTNRKIIEPDSELIKLLGIEDSQEVTYFNLQKYMNKHFVKTDIDQQMS